MRRCPECRSFVPEAAHACPNCTFTPSPASKKGFWMAGMAMLGAGAFSCVMQAIYGAPCVSAALGDGGIDECNTDPCNQKHADGGIKANDPEFDALCGNPDG